LKTFVLQGFYKTSLVIYYSKTETSLSYFHYKSRKRLKKNIF